RAGPAAGKCGARGATAAAPAGGTVRLRDPGTRGRSATGAGRATGAGSGPGQRAAGRRADRRRTHRGRGRPVGGTEVGPMSTEANATAHAPAHQATYSHGVRKAPFLFLS